MIRSRLLTGWLALMVAMVLAEWLSAAEPERKLNVLLIVVDELNMLTVAPWMRSDLWKSLAMAGAAANLYL